MNTVIEFFKKNKVKIIQIAIFLSILLLDIKFIYNYGVSRLNSDMAAEMVLANLLNKEGCIISQNWYYSTEIRVLYQQLFFRPFLYLMGDNWLLVRTAGMAIMLLAYACAVYYLYKQVNPESNIKCLVAASLLLPIAYWYLNAIIFSGSYIPHLLCMILSLGIIMRISFCAEDSKIKTNILLIIILILLAFIGGLNGVRCLMNLYIPAFGASFIVIILCARKNGRYIFSIRESQNRLMLLSFIATLASVFGYLINSQVLSKKYSFLNMSSQMWGDTDISEMLGIWSWFLSSFGYQSSKFTSIYQNNPTDPKLFSFQGIVGAVGLLLAAGVIVSVFRLLKRLEIIDVKQAFLTVVFVLIFFVASISMAWTYGQDAGGPALWAPVVPFAIMVVWTEIETEDYKVAINKNLLWCIFMIFMALTSYCTRKEYVREPLMAQPNLKGVVDWLIDNGYEQGFTNAWTSNLLTEISSGKIEIWSVDNLNTIIDADNTHEWLQKKDHKYLLPEKKSFVLIPYGTDYHVLDYVEEDLSNVVYEYEGYTVIDVEKYLKDIKK